MSPNAGSIVERAAKAQERQQQRVGLDCRAGQPCWNRRPRAGHCLAAKGRQVDAQIRSSGLLESARRGPVDGPYNSLVSVGGKSLIFEIEGATIGSRELMNEVEAFFACIQPADVLAKFPEGQRP
ncbi:MAG: hypothetical protein EOS26_03355 [Mesorhizobium sp.]|nr:MAG: hypothetical protein EOS26_03355 [Mesorhizobium sp.]